MAWPTTRYAQTLDHLIHQPSLIFGGNMTGLKAILVSQFVVLATTTGNPQGKQWAGLFWFVFSPRKK